MFRTLKDWAGKLKREIRMLYFAFRHPNLPLLSKILLGITMAYAFSPIDLIPDFIPILGYLDDLLLLPLLIFLSLKTVPDEIIAEARRRTKQEFVAPTKFGRAAACCIVLLWLLLAAGLLKLWLLFGG